MGVLEVGYHWTIFPWDGCTTSVAYSYDYKLLARNLEQEMVPPILHYGWLESELSQSALSSKCREFLLLALLMRFFVPNAGKREACKGR
jgi:hypothetical protein